MKRLLSLLTLLASTTALVGVGHAQAQSLPQNPQLATGSASVKQTGAGQTTITQTSQSAILNWKSFSIAQGNTVNVLQPGTSAVLLNRVTGTTTSTIAGQLNANGQVFLVNPNGIVIDKTGSIQASGFVASTLDISDADFLSGKLNFKAVGAGASVVDAGAIRITSGGYAALLGGSVTDTGEIIAPMGKVAIGAGTAATLDLSGDGFLQVAMADTTGNSTAVVSAGDARDLVRQTVNMDGVDVATSASGQNGHIILSGRIDTSSISGQGVSGQGGDVKVLGTTLDLSGGVISAGNAQVETSGDTVNFSGITVVAGNWLIDPVNLTIDNAAAATISSNLATTDVTLQTTASGASGAGVQSSGAGDIIVDSAIGWGSSHQLTLNAYHGISIDAPITVTGAGKVSLITANGGDYDYDFGLGASGFAGNLSFTGAANTGQALNINGQAYTLLYSLADIDAVRLPSATSTGYYALANSLDATGHAYVFGLLNNFGGTLTGLGHVVSHVTSSTDGLAQSLSGTARDIGLTQAAITGGDNGAGGLVLVNSGTLLNTYVTGTVSSSGTTGGLVSDNNGTISQSFSNATVVGNNSVGGLAGVNFGTIGNAYATGAVTGALQGVGGLVGLNFSTISSAYATGNVNDNDNGSGQGAGGLVGINRLGSTISLSYAAGNVADLGKVVTVGGLVGENDGQISQSFATGAVSGTGTTDGVKDIGGLIGINTGTAANVYAMGAINGSGGNYITLGGLVGDNSSGTVGNAYATGYINPNGATQKWGLGGGAATTFVNSFYDTTTTGVTYGTGSSTLQGRASSQLMGSLPVDFSSSIWGMGTNLFPYLKGIYTNGVQAIYGYAVGAITAGGEVKIYSNGAVLSDQMAGYNGMFYALLPAGTLSPTASIAETLKLNGASSISSLNYAELVESNGTGYNAGNVANTYLQATTTATNYSGLLSRLATTFGASYAGVVSGIAKANEKLQIENGGFTQDAAPISSGSLSIEADTGDITIAVPLTIQGAGLTLSGTAIKLDADVSLSAPGASAYLQTGYYGNNPSLGCTYCLVYTNDLSLAPGISLQFTGLANSGQTYRFNGNSYTLLFTAADLAKINGDIDGGFVLARTIDASGTTYNQSPITEFAGQFDGMGNAITGLTINNAFGGAGLFRTLDSYSQVRNLSLLGGSVSGVTDVGALAADSGATVTNVFSSVNVTGAGGAGTNGNAGGLIGLNSGTLQGDVATGTVTSNLADTGAHTGGLIGENTGVMSQSSASGAVSGDYAVGGLVGYNSTGRTSANIVDSIASGPVNANAGYGGGLVGINDGLVETSYATGMVVPGGLASGGLVGQEGSNAATKITDAYYDAATTGRASGIQADGSVGLTTAQLQGALPTGFNLDVWGTGSGLYPYLKRFYPNGAKAVTGLATTANAASIAAGAKVSFYANGTQLGSTAYSGANGYYYDAVSANLVGATTPIGATMTLAGASGISGISFVDVHGVTGDAVDNRAVVAGRFYAWVNLPTLSATIAQMNTAFGTSLFDTLKTTAPYTQTDLYSIAPTFTIDVAQEVGKVFKVTEANHTGTLIDAAPITVEPGATVMFISDGALTIDAPMSLKGHSFANLQYDVWPSMNGVTVDPSAFSVGTGGGITYLTSAGGIATSDQGGVFGLNTVVYTLVYSMAQLDALDGINAVNGAATTVYGPGTSSNYALATDLDATGTTYDQALLGNFSGNFDGLGHSISNLTIDYTATTGNNLVGLFGSLSGVVRNLDLINLSLTANDPSGDHPVVGGLVGYDNGGLYNDSVGGDVNAYGVQNSNVGGAVGYGSFATIENVSTSDTVESGRGDNVGGLMGLSYHATVTGASSTGAVGGGDNADIGGLIGYAGDGTIARSSYSRSAVSGGTGSMEGGLVGYSNGTIDQSYATGNVTSVDSLSGGFAGYNDGAIIQSYSLGTVSADSNTNTPVGGFIGVNAGTIASSYSAGGIFATDQGSTGGFVGRTSGTFTNVYWNTTTSGLSRATGSGSGTGATGLSTTQLQSGTLPAGFSAAVWTATAGQNPKLISVAGQ